MTEFTKTKMHFALALLGTLFAVHPFIEKLDNTGFTYLSYRLEVFHAYATTAALLATAIYCYAVALLSERPASRMERVGNYLYALGILIGPLYGMLYLSHMAGDALKESGLLAEWMDKSMLDGIGPTVATGTGVFWLVLSQVLALYWRQRLGAQDNATKLEQLAEQEIEALNRAQEMFQGQHYDLSVIEAWKALTARLRRVLLLRGYSGVQDSPEAMLKTATKAKIIQPSAVSLVQDLRQQWNVAISTDPLTRDAAEKALLATRNILSSIAVSDPVSPAKAKV
jgi:hypothetical protein